MTSLASGYKYEGDELSLFAHARNWKIYFARMLRPYLGIQIAEVGAGNGSTNEILNSGGHSLWYAIEPDNNLLSELILKQNAGRLRSNIVPVNGTIDDLAGKGPVDTIVYIDVLEHIYDDLGELRRAACHLRSGGHLVVLSPAYQILYTPFDEAIGHYRRYTLGGLKRLAGHELVFETGFYLDAVGLVTSLANQLFLKQSKPTISQILFWDRYLVPCSLLIDKITGFRVGRSVVAVWRRK